LTSNLGAKGSVIAAAGRDSGGHVLTERAGFEEADGLEETPEACSSAGLKATATLADADLEAEGGSDVGEAALAARVSIRYF